MIKCVAEKLIKVVDLMKSVVKIKVWKVDKILAMFYHTKDSYEMLRYVMYRLTTSWHNHWGGVGT